LWLEDFNNCYSVVRNLHMRVAENAVERPDGPFIAAFKEGKAIQQFDTARGQGVTASPQPAWALAEFPVWLAVPLQQRNRQMGFIVLAPPRAPQTLNWESFDLLRIIGQQIASYLTEERMMAQLVDARALIEYSKSFGFIAHDVKNIANQLSLVVANVAKFGDDPLFRADMVRTLRHATAKLTRLFEEPKQDEQRTPAPIDPLPVIRLVAETFSDQGRNVVMDVDAGHTRIKITPAQLDSVITHLLDNAFEASSPGQDVHLRLRAAKGYVTIAIEDSGAGMDAAFIREVLFTPRRSTKPKGHGMGAYQVREIVRAAGGTVQVSSIVGKGTVFQVELPDVGSPESAAMEEAGLSE